MKNFYVGPDGILRASESVAAGETVTVTTFSGQTTEVPVSEPFPRRRIEALAALSERWQCEAKLFIDGERAA